MEAYCQVGRLNKLLLMRARGSVRSLVRKSNLWLGLLALAIQAFVIQTHVHLHADELALARVDRLPAKVVNSGANLARADYSSSETSPAKDDPDDCPLCHALAMTGNALTPELAPTVALKLVSFVIETPLDTGFHIAVISHSWLSRGPPRA